MPCAERWAFAGLVFADAATLAWNALADAASYDVYMGNLTDLALLAGMEKYGCDATDPPLLQGETSWTPPPAASGETKFFLVAGENAVGRGTLGYDSPESAERLPKASCP